MNVIKSLKNVAVDFSREEDGAQVVEYALIIALVSIGLAVALSTAFGGATGAMKTLVDRVKTCFSSTTSSC
ncbi:Flp family type IVb pilin [Telluria mixta]|uniref:Flp family type IVb pilin n=1 Tax=Telluria mixta TaxID=34071 RepID=A0ABT2BSB7_9BURK|nr:Flp family type IVb pilin [Telluria mixta]MCS0628016.1 Flp family type IVb pilin [Telluria mixta]WEM93867.1 Flp family type IVb pilin [Telluria mixta]